MHAVTGENRRKARHRLLLWFFVAGALAPVAWVSLFCVIPSWSISLGIFDPLLFAVVLTTFPTQFLFLDAENFPAIIFMLLVTMPINGAWFAVIGLAFWHLREGLSLLKRRSNEPRSSPG
jgi:hypothetical protein